MLLLVNLPVHVLLETPTPLETIISAAGSVLTFLTTSASSITAWLIADPMAVMFLAIMFVMLGLHFVKSFIRTA